MATTDNPRGSNDEEVRRLREHAARAFGIKLGEDAPGGADRNMVGLREGSVLVSRRLDSRTFFVHDEEYGIGRASGSYEGDDDAFIAAARRALERSGILTDEIAATRVLAEQTQAAEMGPDGPKLEEIARGKKLARLERRVGELPVWSSQTLLGLTGDRRIGFLQLHWPEIPDEVIERGRKLADAVAGGWQPPELPGARPESVEAGIIHSPAVGFVMDIQSVIRVIYQAVDEGIGRKAVRYVDENGADVPIPRQLEIKAEEPVSRPPVEAEPGPEDETIRLRRQFRGLLLGNANYFGTLKESPLEVIFPKQGDTTYEDLVCVGYQPQLRRLEAVVHVKQSSGYLGGLCTPGSPEYVRFFLSFDGGATWDDQGMASFAARDVPGPHPLEYAVTLPITPRSRFCFVENLPLVRAILSWNDPPPAGNPGFTPVWGRVRQARIQVEPRRLIIFDDLLAEAKIKLPEPLQALIEPGQEVALKSAPGPAVAELHARYRGSDVPPHRYLAPTLQALVAKPGITLATADLAIAKSLAELDLDLGPIISQLFTTDGNTDYEEMTCLGYNVSPAEESVAAVIKLKRASGYSGGLCEPGSREYVAFWIDAGSGWTHLGTSSVTVHDVTGIPPEGLFYAVRLPVDLSHLRCPCERGPRTVRLRAILSWNTPPPASDPNHVPTWGNREQTTILLEPGPFVGDERIPILSTAGAISVDFIGGDGKANPPIGAGDRPFGGLITLTGRITNPVPGLKYRIVRKPHGAPDSAYAPLTFAPLALDIDVVIGGIPLIIHPTVTPDANGYYPYEDYASDHAVHGDILARWYSSLGEDGNAYDLRLDLSVDGDPAHDLHSSPITILIDNTPPHVLLDIDLGAGVQCADFDADVVFNGHFTATDTHFGSYGWEVEPSGPPNFPSHGHLPTPAGGSTVHGGGAIPDPGLSGAAYQLATGAGPLGPGGTPEPPAMDPCGYSLTLHAWDRAIVNDNTTSNHAEASVGFCLRAP